MPVLEGQGCAWVQLPRGDAASALHPWNGHMWLGRVLTVWRPTGDGLRTVLAALKSSYGATSRPQCNGQWLSAGSYWTGPRALVCCPSVGACASGHARMLSESVLPVIEPQAAACGCNVLY